MSKKPTFGPDFDSWADSLLADPQYGGYTKPELRSIWTQHYGLAGGETAKPKEPGIMDRLLQGGRDALSNARLGASTDPESIAGEIASSSSAALPPSAAQRQMASEIAPAQQEYEESSGYDAVGKFAMLAAKRIAQFARNPREFAGMVAQNLPNSLPGLAGGVGGAVVGSAVGPAGTLGGAVAGGTAGGYLIERGDALRSQILKEAEARGIDPRDANALAPLVQEMYQQFAESANLKGIGTAGLDAVLNALTLGVAGMGERTLVREARTLADGVKAGTISREAAEAGLKDITRRQAERSTLGAKAARGAGVTAAEVAGEGGSEGFGQLLAYGQADALDVIDEALIGGAHGPAMAAGRGIMDKVVGGTAGSPGNVESAIADAQKQIGQMRAQQIIQEDVQAAQRTQQQVQDVMAAGSIDEIVAAATGAPAAETPAVFRSGAGIPEGVQAPVSSIASPLGGDIETPAFARAGREIAGVQPLAASPAAPQAGGNTQAAPDAIGAPGASASSIPADGSVPERAGQVFLDALSRVSPRAFEALVAATQRLTGANDMRGLGSALASRFTDRAFWSELTRAAGTEAATVATAAYQAMQLAAKQAPALQPALVHIKDAAQLASQPDIGRQRAALQQQYQDGAITLRELRDRIGALDAAEQKLQGTPRGAPTGSVEDVTLRDQEAAQQLAGMAGRPLAATETARGTRLQKVDSGSDAAAVEELKASISADTATFQGQPTPVAAAVASLRAVPDVKLPGIALARAFAEKLGRRVVVVDSDGDTAPFNGAVVSRGTGGASKGVLFLHAKTKRPAVAVVGHELLHTLAPELRAKLAKALEPMIGEAKIAERMKLGLSREAAIEEVMADIVGNRFTEASFWKFLERKNPSLFREFAQRAIEVIGRILEAMKQGLGLFGADEGLSTSQLRRARVTIANVLAEHARSLSPDELKSAGLRSADFATSDNNVTGPRAERKEARSNIARGAMEDRGVDFSRDSVYHTEHDEASNDGLPGVQGLAPSQGQVQQPKQPGLRKVRGEGDQDAPGMGGGLPQVLRGGVVSPDATAQPGSDRRQQELRAGQRQVGDKEGAEGEPGGAGAHDRAGWKAPIRRRLGEGSGDTEADDLQQDQVGQAGRGRAQRDQADRWNPAPADVRRQDANLDGVGKRAGDGPEIARRATGQRVAAGEGAGNQQHATSSQPRDELGRFASRAAEPRTQFSIDQFELRKLGPAGASFLKNKKGWAILTAENPNAQPATPEENARAMAKLKADLDERGLTYINVTGKYGSEENSLIVLGEIDPVDFARRYNQEAVLMPHGFVYQDGSVQPARGVQVFKDKPDDFFTEMPGHTYFQVDIDWDAPRQKQGGAQFSRELSQAAATGIELTENQRRASLERDLYGEFSLQEDLPRFANQAEFGAWLNRRIGTDKFAGNYGSNAEKHVAGLIAHESILALRQDKNAAHWYRDSIEGAMREAAKLYPEIGAGGDARFIFSMALALTSNGQAIPDNVRMAFDAYDAWDKDGKFSRSVEGAGERTSTINAGLRRFNEMVAWAGSVRTLRQFLLSKRTVREIEDSLEMKISGENKDSVVYGGAVFGPKVGGGFLPNLNGLYDALTIDRWLARTYNRLTGNMLDARGQIQNGPRNGSEREFLRGAFARAVGMVREQGWDVDVADMQALLWYPEKELYAKYGVSDVRAAPTDYHQEARRHVEQHQQKRGRSTARQKPGGGRAAADVADRQVALFSAEPDGPGRVGAADAPYSRRQPVEGSVAVEGVHWGKREGLSWLSGTAYGSGLKGAERERLAHSTDERIKRRVYFYVARPDGTLPLREAGVGPFKYTAAIGNLYDPRTGSAKISAADANGFEAAVLDAGFDGYLAPDMGMAVVLDSDVPVTSHGMAADEGVVRAAPKGRTKIALLASELRRLDEMMPRLKEIDPGITERAGMLLVDEELAGKVRRALGVPTIAGTPKFSQEFEFDDLDEFDVADPYVLDLTQHDDLKGPKIVPEQADRHAARRWLALAKDRRLFASKTSDDTELESIAWDIGQLRATKWRPADPIERVDGATSAARITMPRRGKDDEGAHATVLKDNKGHVWVNAVLLRKGAQEGSLIYPIVANYAHNNGLKFIGDPAGLSDAAVFRRTEQMLASALKFGTTDHLAPHQRQLDAGLAWRDGDTEYNIAAMLAWSREKVLDAVPALYELGYDPATGQITDSQGEVIDERGLRALLDAAGGRDVEAGWRTAARTVATNEFVAEYERGVRETPERLPAAMRGVSYSREQENTQEFKRFFRASKVVDEAGRPLRAYHGSRSNITKFDGKMKAYPGTKIVRSDGRIDAYHMDPAEDWVAEAPVASALRLPTVRGKDGWIITISGERPYFSRYSTADEVAAELRRKVNPTTWVSERAEALEGASFFAEDPAYTGVYSKKEYEDRPATLDGGVTYPVYLSIQNPVDPETSFEDFRQFYERAIAKARASGEDMVGIEEMRKMFEMGHWAVKEGIPGFVAEAKRLGYDGFINYEGIATAFRLGITPTREQLQRVWVTFYPEQVKSAIGNDGSFDPANPDIRYSNEIPAWISGGPAALQSAAGKINTYAPAQPLREKARGMFERLRKSWVQGLVDAYSPLKTISPEAYVAARMVKSGDGVVEAMLMYGKPVMDADGAIHGNLDGKGFLGVMQDLAGEHDRFMMWLAGNRAGRLAGEGRENLFTPAEIAEMQALNRGSMADGRSREQVYLRTLAEFNDYGRSVLDVAQQSGLIDAESRATWESEFYVPFYRVMDEADRETKGPGMVKGLVRQKAFERLKGGKENLGDLLENTLRNWQHLINASLANQAAGKALTAAAQVGAAIEATSSSAQEMAKSMGKKGGAVYFMDAGAQRWFVVDDPFVLEAITAMEAVPAKGLPMDVMRAFKNVLTMGTTIAPAFKVRNLMRDTVAAIGQNEMSYNAITNLAQGWSGTSRQSADYAQMMFGGALMRFGNYMDGTNAEHVKRLIESGLDDQTVLDTSEKVKVALTRAWDWWQEVGDRMENVNRAALYQQRRAAGDSHLAASFAARDMMDFSLQGSWTAVRFLTQVVPFLNARLQGLYKLGRAGAENPRRLGYVLGAVIAASWALLLAYQDDEDWKRREDWDRDNFWWFKIGGVAYRIPKPFEIGAMGTIAERSLELAISDEMGGKRFAERMKQVLASTFELNPVPQMFKPLVDIYANRDSFTGREIETMGMERLSKGERAGPNTTLVARTIGAAGGVTGLSPVQVDHLVRAYAGWMGAQALWTVDMMARPFADNARPALKADDFLGGFVKGLPQSGSRYLTEFYEHSKAIQQVMADIKLARETGEIEKARDLMSVYRVELSQAKLYSQARTQIGKINDQIKAVRNDVRLDAAKKRELMEALTQRKNALAERVSSQARQRARSMSGG